MGWERYYQGLMIAPVLPGLFLHGRDDTPWACLLVRINCGPMRAVNAARNQVPVSQTKLQGGSSIRPAVMVSRPVVECTGTGSYRPARAMIPASGAWVTSLKLVSDSNGALRGWARR